MIRRLFAFLFSFSGPIRPATSARQRYERQQAERQQRHD